MQDLRTPIKNEIHSKNSSTLRRYFRQIVGALLSAVLFAPLLSTQQVQAMDAAAIGNATTALGGVMMGVAVMDTVGSGMDCSCMVTGASCPKGVAGFCSMMGLNIAAAIASLIPMASGSDTANSVAGGGSFDGGIPSTFDPNVPLAQVIGCPPGSPTCDCSGPGAQYNILCGKPSLENLKGQLVDIKGKLNDGSMTIPDGQTAEGLLAGIDNASAGLDSLLNGQIPGVETGSIGDVLGGGKSSGGGKTGTEILAGGTSDSFDANAALGGGAGKAGPSDRAGLGKIMFNGGLDAIDENTGKSLTLWQRSTRRYQGNEKGSRAFLMAKIEVMRKNATKGLALAKASESKAGPTSDRKPASITQVAAPVVESQPTKFQPQVKSSPLKGSH